MTATGYFTDKARAVFIRAKGDPENAGPLAEWAEAEWAAGYNRQGVIVAEDGTLLAETRHTPATASTPGATYVTRLLVDLPPHEAATIGSLEVGLATGALQRSTGQHAIHVKHWEVCTGSGQHARHPQDVR
jgi:hypothetical protein